VILVDTSVWIDHFRRDNHTLADLLEGGGAWTHEFVMGELATGNLNRRTEILYYLEHLPRAGTAGHDEVLGLIEDRKLHGIGLGWIDAHLLASAMLEGLPLWSLDKTLAGVARRLGVGTT
jgi:predicted nucleic acid-binding protein